MGDVSTITANMAALMSIALRNYGKVASANRLLFSNPCFAPLRQGLLNGKVNGNQSATAALAVKPFSLSAKSFQEGDCSSGENYAKLWTIERGVAIALIPLVPAAFLFTSPTMDYLVAFTFTLHAHWGIEASVIDYLRPKVVGETIAKFSLAMIYVISAFTLGGLCYFNYTDVGIINAIKMLWKL